MVFRKPEVRVGEEAAFQSVGAPGDRTIVVSVQSCMTVHPPPPSFAQSHVQFLDGSQNNDTYEVLQTWLTSDLPTSGALGVGRPALGDACERGGGCDYGAGVCGPLWGRGGEGGFTLGNMCFLDAIFWGMLGESERKGGRYDVGRGR